MTTASCPCCEAETPPQASRCQSCGFVFFEERVRRRFPGSVRSRQPWWRWPWPSSQALSYSSPVTSPPPPANRPDRWPKRSPSAAWRPNSPTPATTTPRRCAVGAPYRLGGATRCQVRYANGDTQLILVGLDGRGELDITIPYPAQRRPAD